MRAKIRLLLTFTLLLALAVTTASLVLAQDGGVPGIPQPRLPDDVNLPLTADYTYTIRRGDTVDTIAALFDVQRQCVQEVNNLRPAQIIFPGEELLISVSCPAYDGVGFVPFFRVERQPSLHTQLQRQAFAPTTQDGVGGGIVDLPGDVYVVRRGDTLDVIAQVYNVSLQSLKRANDITHGYLLRPGQEIIIPADAPPYGMFPALDIPAGQDGVGGGVAGELYVMQPRETIDGISARFNVDTRCVIEANQIRNTRRVHAGQTIVIPAGCPPYAGFDVVPDTAPGPAQAPVVPDSDNGEAPPTGEG
jgi:LysM repeat protein